MSQDTYRRLRVTLDLVGAVLALSLLVALCLILLVPPC